MESRAPFAANLERLRRERNLSQTEVSEALGVSQSSFCAWERGKSRPTLEKLIELAQYYKVSLDQLCGLSTETTKPIQTKADLVSAITNLQRVGAHVENEEYSYMDAAYEGVHVVIYMPEMPWLTDFFDGYEKLRGIQRQGLIDEGVTRDWLSAQRAKFEKEPLDTPPSAAAPLAKEPV